MALNQLPIIEATISIIHTGPSAGDSFTATLDASDGAPMAPQQVFTFDLTVFAPDLVGVPAPLVQVVRDATGEVVQVDADILADVITLTFWEPVEPTEYRVKVMG